MKISISNPMSKFLTLAAAALVALVGNVLAADNAGEVTTVDRSFSAFYGIVVNTHANVILQQGDKPAVRIEGRKRELDKVDVKVNNGLLVIDGDNNAPVDIYVTVEELNRVEVNSTARVFASGLIHSDVLFLKVNGNGSIKMDVRALSVGMIVKGKGKIVISGTAGESYSRILGDGRILSSGFDTYSSRSEVQRARTATVQESDKSGRRMTLRMSN